MQVRSEQTARARGQRMREARQAAGLAVDDVASTLNVRPNTVYRWEWGACAPHVDDVPEIAAAYRTSVGWIVAGESTRRGRKCA